MKQSTITTPFIHVVALLVLLTTSTGASANNKIDPSWPTWLQEAMAKEYDNMPYASVAVWGSSTIMPARSRLASL